MALLGGRLGGGFAAPPINSPLVGYDYTEPFRRVVSACAPPVGVDPRSNGSACGSGFSSIATARWPRRR